MKNKLALISFIFLGLALSSCNMHDTDDEDAIQKPSDAGIAKSEYPAEPDLEVSGEDFGDVIINAPRVAYLALKNEGSLPIDKLALENLSSALSYEGGAFPGTTGNCPASLAAGTGCLIALELAANSNSGTFELKSELAFDYAGKIYKKPITFRAFFKDFAYLSVNNVNFGAVNVGAVKVQKLRLKNDSAHEMIKNLTLTQDTNSEFTILNTAACSSIAPGATCVLDVKFSPKNFAPNIDGEVVIDYDTMGQRKTEKISLRAQAADDSFIAVNGYAFSNVVGYKKNGQITLNVSNAPGNIVDVENIRFGKDELKNAGFKLDPASTCTVAGAKINNFVNNCTIVLNSLSPIIASTPVNGNIKLEYDVNTANKEMTISLNGNFDIKLLDSVGQNFGDTYFNVGQTVPLQITVTNPAQSSLLLAKGFKLRGKKLGSPLIPLSVDKDPTKSTCLAPNKVLAPNQSCIFVVNAKPNVPTPNFAANIRLLYLDNNGNVLTLPLALTGSFKLAGAKKLSFLNLLGSEFNLVPNLNFPGGSFEVTLTLLNTSSTETAKNIKLDRISNWGGIQTWSPYFIEKDPIKSTCIVNSTLAPNASCVYVLKVTPDPADPDSIDKAFQISFIDSTNLQMNHTFNLKGSWSFAVPQQGPIGAGNAAPPTMRDATFQKHEYFPYEKREIKNANPNTKYPQWVWNLLNGIGNTITAFLNHVPWTFKTKPQWDSVVKIGDIVPDRIMDPTTGQPYMDPITGKKYVRLFHGTTSDLLPTFMVGANALKFDVATFYQLGMGFYLAANPNESKSYACGRYIQRLNNPLIVKPPNFRPILLVIGVEEDVTGRESEDPLSYANGDPKEANVYFRKNSQEKQNIFTQGKNNGLYNQFVFFSNIKNPDLKIKIFEVIRLGKNFGMSLSNHDEDGYPTSSNVPDGVQYKCIH